MTKDDEPEEQKTERFNMFMTPSEMKALDDWAWENRVRSKSEAVRRLVQVGMRALHHYETMTPAISAAAEQVIATFNAWDDLIAEYKDKPGPPDIDLYAYEIASLFFNRFPDVGDRTLDAYNMFIDLGAELREIAGAPSITEAIAAADKERAEAQERWRKWREEDGVTALEESVERVRAAKSEESEE